MITVEEAQNIVGGFKANWGTELVPVDQAVGRVLAEGVAADRDFPPFDRVTMDGIAINYKAYAAGQREFEVQGVQLAGEPAQTLEDEAMALEIMTGAILAVNTDTVIRYEDLEFSEREGKKFVKILDEEVKQWKNVHKQGSDEKAGKTLLKAGTKINSTIVSILATVGKAEVLVRKWPKVAVIATGDELVDVGVDPLPHQIRKSNVITIQAELNKLGVENKLFHLLDDKDTLLIKVKEILEEYDALILSGAVSKGKADYLPEVFDELGVEKKFHRVAQRPGKPFWFGVFNKRIPVFACPGNPISTIMTFRVYFLEWLYAQMGIKSPVSKAVLEVDFSFRPDFGYFLQVSSSVNAEGQLTAIPQAGNGSGDIANLSVSDAFIYLPQGKTEYKAGEVFDWYGF